METELFNRQYIISEKELALDGWKQFLFDNYHVYVHPNLDYVHRWEIFVCGSIGLSV